jgi:hypothetical protein
MPQDRCDGDIPETMPTENFDINWTYGIAFDKRTKLTWKLCAEGQTYDDGICTDNAVGYSWDEAVEKFGDRGTGWRLPTILELKQIVEKRCQAPSVNADVFPSMPPTPFWTSTLDESDPGRAMYVNFFYGNSNSASIASKHMVKLVRGEDMKVREERQELLRELMTQTTTDEIVDLEKEAELKATVVCTSKARCEKLYSLTSSYIAAETGKQTERVSETLIRSPDPAEIGDVGMVATMIPGNGNTATIRLSVSCKTFGTDTIIDNLKSETEAWEKLRTKMKKSKVACLSKKLAIYNDFRTFVTND